MTYSYMVLDLNTNRIIRDLPEGAMLVVLKVLMSLPNPSFEVVETSTGKRRFVTHKYRSDEAGNWSKVTEEAIEAT